MQSSTMNKTLLIVAFIDKKIFAFFFTRAIVPLAQKTRRNFDDRFLACLRKPLEFLIFLAGLFSALVSPLYRRFVNWYGGRRTLASLTTLLLITLFILLPLAGLMGIVTTQAIKVGESVKPWVQEQIASPTTLLSKLEALPFYDQVLPYRDLIFQKAGCRQYCSPLVPDASDQGTAV